MVRIKTSNCQSFEEEVVLIDKTAKFIKPSTAEILRIRQDLHDKDSTLPSTRTAEEYRLHNTLNSVVLPAPEGPIMASISPALQYPEQSLRSFLSSAYAQRFCQVSETILVFFIYYWYNVVDNNFILMNIKHKDGSEMGKKLSIRNLFSNTSLLLSPKSEH